MDDNVIEWVHVSRVKHFNKDVRPADKRNREKDVLRREKFMAQGLRANGKPYAKIVTPEEIRARGYPMQKGERYAQTKVITKETAVQIARMGWEKAREKAQEGLMRGVNNVIDEIGPGGTMPIARMPAEAFGNLIQHATEVYLKSKSPKGMSDLGSFIGKATGLVKDLADKDAETEQGPMFKLEDAQFILQVNNYYQGNKEEPKDIIDVRPSEVS